MGGRGSNMTGLSELKYHQTIRKGNQLLAETRGFKNSIGLIMLRATVMGM